MRLSDAILCYKFVGCGRIFKQTHTCVRIWLAHAMWSMGWRGRLCNVSNYSVSVGLFICMTSAIISADRGAIYLTSEGLMPSEPLVTPQDSSSRQPKAGRRYHSLNRFFSRLFCRLVWKYRGYTIITTQTQRGRILGQIRSCPFVAQTPHLDESARHRQSLLHHCLFARPKLSRLVWNAAH